jgi:hypothetical protein
LLNGPNFGRCYDFPLAGCGINGWVLCTRRGRTTRTLLSALCGHGISTVRGLGAVRRQAWGRMAQPLLFFAIWIRHICWHGTGTDHGERQNRHFGQVLTSSYVWLQPSHSPQASSLREIKADSLGSRVCKEESEIRYHRERMLTRVKKEHPENVIVCTVCIASRRHLISS